MDARDEGGAGLLPPRYRDPVLVAIGGMGAVYRAHDERLGRDVAVKMPSEAIAADETASRRFRREAVSAARVHHEHVALVYDVGEHGGRPYLVMQYVPGGTIADRLAGGRPPRAQALEWVAQTAAALDAAHAAGVVHRDVKPANLLLDEGDRVKVADFGIARVLDDRATSLTLPGTVLGTTGYAAPEQAQGLPATPASDVYALAKVAAELLGGELARAADLPVPVVAFVTVEPELGAAEPDAEIRDLLKRSPGLNLGLDFLPGALAYDPAAGTEVDPSWAAQVVWLDALLQNVDRTARNPNLLVWHGRVWLIDHGAALFPHHGDPLLRDAWARPFPQIGEHVLLPAAGPLAPAGARVAAALDDAAIARSVGALPDAWLDDTPEADPDARRAAYAHHLRRRRDRHAELSEEAERARGA